MCNYYVITKIIALKYVLSIQTFILEKILFYVYALYIERCITELLITCKSDNFDIFSINFYNILRRWFSWFHLICIQILTDVLLTLTVWYIPTWGQYINSSSKNCFTKRLWKSLEPNNALAQCKQYGVFFCTKITYKVRLHHLLFSKMNIITKRFFFAFCCCTSM